MFQCILIMIMIARAQIGKFLSFPWLRLSFSLVSEKMKSTLSEKAQSAVWSQTILDTICEAKASDNITDLSLRENLLNIQHPADSISDPIQKTKILSNNILSFDDVLRRDFLRIFKDGAVLSEAVFKQQRIKSSKQPSKQQNKRRFVFCPNYLVTQPMFQKLRWEQSDMLIYGPIGISKTAAIILFNYLSSIINTFVYQSFSDKAQKQELNFLRANKLITDTPKLFYWSLSLQDDQSELQSLIIAQATELSEQQRKQLSKIVNFPTFIESLKMKYDDKGITVRTVIDQINVLADIFRQWNHFINSYKQNSKKWKQREQNYNKKRQKGEFLRTLTEEYRKLGQSTFYNSPILIEQNLIAVQQDYSKERTLNIDNNHQHIAKHKIEYTEGLDNKWGCNDFSHILWFEIQKRLKQKISLNEDTLKRLKNTLYEKVKDYKWPKYLRFLNIRKMFEKKEAQLKIVYSKCKQIQTLRNDNPQYETKITNTVTESVCQLVNLLLQSSIEDYRQNLKQFIHKNGSLQVKSDRINIFFAFLSVAQQCIDKKKPFQVQITTLQTIVKTYFPSESKQVSNYLSKIEKCLGQNSQHQELFQIQKKYYKKIIKFLWTPEQFITVVKWTLLSVNLRKQYIDPHIAKFFTQKRGALGSMLESTLCLVLTLPKTEAIFSQEDSKQLFLTYESDSFIQFNNDSSTIPVNCHKLLKIAKQNSDRYIFGSPICQKQSQKTKEMIQFHGSNSECFDGMHIKYNSKAKIFDIYSFDITVNSTSIKDKLDAVIKKLNQKLDISNQYRWHHTILCTQKIKAVHQSAKREDGKTIKWEIKTSSLQQFTVQSSDTNNLDFKKYIRLYNAFRNIWEGHQKQKQSRGWK